MAPLRIVPWTMALCLTMYVLEAAPVAAAGDSPDQFFSYPLRAGESLNGVSRIFGVPVQELVELNQILDPGQLQLGQTLKVPNSAANSFARDAGALRSERDRLLEEKRRSERQFAERQQAASSIDSRLHQLEAEKAALGLEVTSKTAWEKAAKLLSFLLLAAVCWALKARSDRIIVRRRLSSLAAENTLLAAARAMSRGAASQLELRYQKLYDRKGAAELKVIDEGISSLTRTFREGTADIERLVANVGIEREAEKRVLESASWTLAWLIHPVREILLRERIKYYTP